MTVVSAVARGQPRHVPPQTFYMNSIIIGFFLLMTFFCAPSPLKKSSVYGTDYNHNGQTKVLSLLLLTVLRLCQII